MVDQPPIEITIERIFPRDGNKPPAAKSTAGDFFGLPDGYATLLSAGMTGTITYWSKTVPSGKVFHNATHWNGTPIPKVAMEQNPANNVPQPQVAPQPQPAQPVATQHIQTSVKQSSDTAEEIFVTGIVGRALGSGNFTIEDIPRLTMAATAAWRNRNGRMGSNPQNNSPAGLNGGQDPLNDEKPF